MGVNFNSKYFLPNLVASLVLAAGVWILETHLGKWPTIGVLLIMLSLFFYAKGGMLIVIKKDEREKKDA